MGSLHLVSAGGRWWGTASASNWTAIKEKYFGGGTRIYANGTLIKGNGSAGGRGWGTAITGNWTAIKRNWSAGGRGM